MIWSALVTAMALNPGTYVMSKDVEPLGRLAWSLHVRGCPGHACTQERHVYRVPRTPCLASRHFFNLQTCGTCRLLSAFLLSLAGQCLPSTSHWPDSPGHFFPTTHSSSPSTPIHVCSDSTLPSCGRHVALACLAINHGCVPQHTTPNKRTWTASWRLLGTWGCTTSRHRQC